MRVPEDETDPVERRLASHDREVRAEQEHHRSEVAARRELDQQFVLLRAEVIEPAILAVRDRLIEHGHRAEIEEHEHISPAPGLDAPARVSLAILPDGWDLEGARYRFRPRLTFEADGEGHVRVRYWLARPGEPGQGGVRATVPMEDVSREWVDHELQAFVDEVFASSRGTGRERGDR